jgi:integrase
MKPADLALAALSGPEAPLAPLEATRADQNPVLVYLAGRKSERTRQTMRQGLERLARAGGWAKYPVEAIPWHQMTFAHTDALRAALTRQVSQSTVALSLAALRGVSKTAWKLGLVTYEQHARATAWDLGGTPDRLPAGREISPPEIVKLQAYCTAQPTPYGEFLSGIFAVLFGAGMRAHEPGGLTIDAYDPDEHSVRFVRKGRKQAEIPLGGAEAAALEAWIAVRRTLDVPATWLFPRVQRNGIVRAQPITNKGLWHLCKAIGEAASIREFSPHDTRRTYCTRLLSSGLDLATAQRLMSHSSPATTVRYDKRQARADAEARQRVTIWGGEG